MAKSESGSLKLEVPIDASGVDEFTPETIKVAIAGKRGVLASQSVKLDAKGIGSARFDIKSGSQALRVIVGPNDASDEDIVNLQTIVRALPVRATQARELKLSPVIVSSYYWHWWRRWCRTFTVTGRVVCADGSPVPGASVCAYDMDAWWWWTSQQQVGCATTDADGSFTIRFRWCCGWWPWWWWRVRYWQLEPVLVEKIRPLIERLPLRQPLVPSPKPDLAVFDQLLAMDGFPTRPAQETVDPALLPQLREKLVTRLPAAAQLEPLRLWPWWPWHPWWDCTPDLIFKVTQQCQGETRVIVDEHFGDTRWNVPTNLNVTLVANELACCVEDEDTPEGNCLVISRVCSDVVNNIGGNPGAAAAPVGYLNPGAIAVFGDRPYAGTASIEGIFGNTANVDYYEFQWSTTPAGPWNAMPPAAAGGFSRVYWGPQLGGGPVGFHAVPFPFAPIGGHNVAESRQHFEADNEPLSWGLTRFWVSGRDLLMRWITANTFADDTYYLRVAGYTEAGGQLGNPQILPLCNTEDDNGLALTIDNSTSELEPAADIVDVRINGVSAGPCSNIDAADGGTLEVDFVAYDVDRHLAYYNLIATYGKNLAVNLLNAPGATLTPIALGAIPAADVPGPDYGQARLQGAASPHWRAGGLRLTVPNLHDAFPETCCYQLELRVYKRTVVSCDHDYRPWTLSYYSLTVVV